VSKNLHSDRSNRRLDLDKFSKSDREFLLRVGRQIIAQLALKDIASKQLDITDIEGDELKEKIRERIKATLAAGEIHFALRIDHTRDLLREARSRFRSDDFDLSAIFYATFFERKINFILVELCERRRLAEKISRSIIREANLTAKCTWILELLGSHSLKKTWLTRTNEISDIRNAFVHYKWTASSDDSSAVDGHKAAKLKQAEAIVRYLGRFEERILNVGQGSKVRQALKKVIRKSK
jgi:hypothetical protein